MSLFLGVDGGASFTRAVIGDASGRVIASGEGGPSNHVAAAHGRERLLSALRDSAGEACRRLGRDLENTVFEAAFLGFTGGGTGKQAVVEELIRARHIALSDDSVTALAGALGGTAGIITVAGTGSISLGRNSQGQTARAGGWGFIFGDEGSAYDLTREALRAALRHEEGWGPPTVLHEMLRAAVGLDDIRLVQRKLYTEDYPRDRVASLAPLVERAAELEDHEAIRILRRAAEQLVLITNAVRLRLFAAQEAVSVAYIGGVFRCQAVLSEFKRLLEIDNSHVIEPLHPPAVGALIEAYRLAGKEFAVQD